MMIKGVVHDSYKVELCDLLHVLERADVPTHVALDNEAVVNRADVICRIGNIGDVEHSHDLWVRVYNAVHKTYVSRLSWCKGHLDQHIFPSDNGTFTLKDNNGMNMLTIWLRTTKGKFMPSMGAMGLRKAGQCRICVLLL